MQFFNSLSEEDQKEILASVADSLLDNFFEHYENEGDEVLEEEIFLTCSIKSFKNLFEEYQKQKEADDEI